MNNDNDNEAKEMNNDNLDSYVQALQLMGISLIDAGYAIKR